MNKKIIKIVKSGLFLLLSILPLHYLFAAEQKINTSTQSFSLKLSATRVVYNPASAGSTVTVFNEQNFPILVQSKVLKEDKTSAAPFLVTPPLFRLDAGQQSRIRVVRTGGEFPGDRESLQWLCVTGIPPKASDNWAKDKNGQSGAPKQDAVSLNIQMSVSNCIKLFVRPNTLKGNSIADAGSLVWTKQADKLTVKNPSPFYMNLRLVKIGETEIPNVEAVPPFSSKQFLLPKMASGQVQWQVVTDLGGESRLYQAAIN